MVFRASRSLPGQVHDSEIRGNQQQTKCGIIDESHETSRIRCVTPPSLCNRLDGWWIKLKALWGGHTAALQFYARETVCRSATGSMQCEVGDCDGMHKTYIASIVRLTYLCDVVSERGVHKAGRKCENVSQNACGRLHNGKQSFRRGSIRRKYTFSHRFCKFQVP